MKTIKLLVLLLAVSGLFMLSGCGGAGGDGTHTDENYMGDRPVVRAVNGSVPENSAAGTVVGASVEIIDEGSAPVTRIDLHGTGSAYFEVSVAGEIRVKANAVLDYEAVPAYTFAAVATSSVGESDPVALTITVTDVPDVKPRLADFSGNVDENVPAGTVVGTVTVNDPGDTAITAFTLSTTADFTISAGGTIHTGSSMDYETTVAYHLTVTATNSAGVSNVATVDITVVDIEEYPPLLEDSSMSVYEHADAGTVVGSITITDQGVPAITSIVLTGTGQENFEADNDGVVVVKAGAVLDHDTAPVYHLKAIAANPEGDSNEVDVTIHVKEREHILFAHGMGSTKETWDTFTAYAQDKEWRVYRTNVAKQGSIRQRAEQLATYINTLTLKDNSLVTVGHSMGGLDLRYIVSQGHMDGSGLFYDAAKKIKKIYTMATPHKGNMFGGSGTDANTDLGIAQMKAFNEERPYHTFSIDGRKVPLLALRFSCIGGGLGDAESDGVVAVKRQILNDAPYSHIMFDGRHSDGTSTCSSTVETEQTHKILDLILEDALIETEVANIVYYDEADCEEDEKGAFTDDNQDANCLTEFSCSNDAIGSMMLFPSIRKNVTIKVYNDPLASRRDDWTRIHVGDTTLQEPFCVTEFEHYSTAEEKENNITVTYHESTNTGGDSGINEEISHIRISASTRENDPDNIVFYEGNGCEEGIKGVLDSYKEKDIQCTLNPLTDPKGSCDNDEIRSILLYPGIKKNSVIKLFNDPDASRDDDWTRIHIGDTVLTEAFCITGLEHQTSAREKAKHITVDHHRYDGAIGNGLNGKVSHIKTFGSTKRYDTTNDLIFYEALNCQEGIKGVFKSEEDISVGCTNDLDIPYSYNDNCNNDEIVSLRIYPGVANNMIIKLYNSPDGEKDDDWTRIHIGDTTLTDPFCVNGFEHFTSSRERDINLSMSKHVSDGAFGSGLNGKISYIRTARTHASADPDNIIFYEGLNCTQEIKGAFQSAKKSNAKCSLTGNHPCANDEISSVLLYPGIDVNTTIKLYNDPDGEEVDDWTRIHIGETVLTEPFCINGLEHETSAREADKNITVQFQSIEGVTGDGLNGKVSYIRIYNSKNSTDPTDDIVFYEGDHCTQDVKGSFNSDDAVDITCSSNPLGSVSGKCKNDEIRSVRLYPGIKSNIVIKLYNDPDSSKRDDWTRIHIGDTVLDEPMCINGFEHQTTEREELKNISFSYHQSDNSAMGNGLNGKISHIKIAPESSRFDPDNIIFYEENGCGGGIKGVFRSSNKKEVNCQESDLCDNDEIRSVLLYPGIDKNMLIKVYNDGDAEKNDDWTRVHIGDTTLTKPFCINGFEHQENGSARERDKHITMNYHRDDGGVGDGLNGKISHIKLLDSTQKHDPDNIVFYEDNSCGGNIKGVFQSANHVSKDCTESARCDNDEIRSLLLYPGISENTLIKLYNDPEASKFDDWIRIHIGDTVLDEPFCITGLEHQTSSREEVKDIAVSYHKDDEGTGDGLNGKVSHVKVDTSTSAHDPDDIVYYSDFYCTTGISGVFNSSENTYVSCKDSHRCKNDEIKSVLLYPGVKKYKAMRLYDDPDGSKSKDYVSIYRGSKTIEEPFCIRGLEHDTSDREREQGISVNYHDTSILGKLNGKVSYLKIVPSGDM